MKVYTVQSCNFDWHEPLHHPTFAEALAAAKTRGFEATIKDEESRLIAVWSPLYGLRVYNYNRYNKAMKEENVTS